MSRCLELAAEAKGAVAPNPLVGAVIVHNKRIIGEGYHRKFGADHAEIDAIKAVEDKSLLKDATLYVNLEPCSHHGKTPPCAHAIIHWGIPRVVIGQSDPNPQVSGRGIALLKKAGVEVHSGILETEAKWLNRRFNCFHVKKRPYVILKWAQSENGFVDVLRNSAAEKPKQLSNAAAKDFVHYLRATEDAFLVGYRTALLDNPRLSARGFVLKQALRVLIDRELALPESYHLLDNELPSLVFNAKKNEAKGLLRFCKLDFEAKDWPLLLLKELYKIEVQSLVIEGGPQTHQRFIETNLWDECLRISTPEILGEGVAAASLPFYRLKSRNELGNNVIEQFVNQSE